MKRTKPPFRADHVGSLLRPASLKQAREKHAKGEISAADLKAVEDREIERVIKKQEEVGLQAVTDATTWIPALPLPRSPRATKACR
jgi:5-methyltetrahydropteroyltriglutamate--homocysteine methyltransferase